MMLSSRFWGLSLLTLISIASCSKSSIEDDPIPVPEVFEYTYKIAEGDETKATIGDSRVQWEAGDKVGILSSSFNGEASINTESDPMTVTISSTNPINVGEYLYAYYPYNEANTSASSVKISLPKIQYGESSSAMPLAGIPFEVPYDANESAIRYLNLGSVIAFNIFTTNSAYLEETVKSVTFTTDNPVSGEGTINLTQVSSANLETLVLSGLSEKYVKVYQDAMPGSIKEDGGVVKMVVAPGTYSGQIIVTTDEATYTYSISDKTFNRSAKKTFNVNLANGARVALSVPVKNLPYSVDFTSTQDDSFSVEGEIASANTSVWNWASTYGMKATAYVNKTRYASEGWLISPIINLVGMESPVLSFNHAINYAATPSSVATLWIKDEDGSWKQVTDLDYPTGSDWTYVSSGDIDLSAYVGHQIQLGFKYTSTTSEAATWEIKDINIKEEASTTDPTDPVTPSDPGDNPSTESTKSANGRVWLEMPAGTDAYSNVFLGTLWDSTGSTPARNYTYFYDKDTYTSYWVAYPLYSTTTGGSRSGTWKANPYIDEKYQVNCWSASYNVLYGSTTATDSAASSGNEYYARGHQIPDADRSNNSTMQAQTYYATNSTPQLQNSFNASVWMNLEAKVRNLIPSSDTLYVVTGATLQTIGGNETITYIYPKGDSTKATPVPNYYWKVLLKVKRSGKTVTSASAIGFWLNHVTTYASNAWQNCAVSVDEIEQKTGFNFFVNLPESIEAAAESNSNLTTFSNF